jgi:hypothetical protein
LGIYFDGEFSVGPRDERERLACAGILGMYHPLRLFFDACPKS